jgi:probable HAF family extracellular repeat protein
LVTLGGSSSYAYGINNNGQVVGYSYTPYYGLYHTFLYSGGAMTDLGPPYDYSEALGINNNGQVVGYCLTTTGYYDGFLWSGSEFVDLNTFILNNSTWDFEEATAINDNGQIVGYGINTSGQTHALLLTPIPEPLPWALLALGSLVFMLRKRH